MSEFELIQQYFTDRQPAVAHIPLGIGDDCALLSTRAGTQLAVSTDMLVEGRHFFPNASPRQLGHKALAVNLSDLAAMGAEPRAFSLALALPAANEQWLREFSAGLLELATRHGCYLLGGDTTKGPLNICITVFGEIPDGQALRRDAAQVGDDIWISGTLGDARMALAAFLNQHELQKVELELAAVKLHQPVPRIELGLALRRLAHAAIDLSDGLAGDLGHILQRSQVGATVWCDALPFGDVLSNQDKALQYEFALSGGDDYELCFTASADQRASLLAVARELGIQITRVGFIEAAPGCRYVDASNSPMSFRFKSFDHFQS